MHKNLSLKTKLLAICLVLSSFQLISGAIGYYSTEHLSKTYQHVSDENLTAVELLATMSVATAEFGIDFREIIRPTASMDEQKKAFDVIEKRIAAFEKADAIYKTTDQSDEQVKLYNDAKADWVKLTSFYTRIRKAVESNNEQERRKAMEDALEHLKSSGEKGLEALNKATQLEQTEAHEWVDSAHRQKKIANWTAILTSIIVTLLSMIIAWTFSGWLGRVLTSIAGSLSQGAEKVASASEQITSASRNLSSSATEQASALQETAASVEEMSAMVQKNSENAQKSSERTKGTHDSANSGKQIMEELTQAISEISQSNHAIVEQTETSNREIGEIVKLIADIANKTTVINDIVFQTKLLSFNASVEAARAGEHGKGFAVVAEEVGNLAQMSGKAAQEIGVMVNDSIQRVEQIVKDSKSRIERMVSIGKEKVERGAEISQRCKQVLDGIASDVESVSLMSGEISMACQEQANGVREINQAMGQLDQVTQRNAVSARQAAASAEELFRQADSLRGAVSDLLKAVHGTSSMASMHESLSVTSAPVKSAATPAVPAAKVKAVQTPAPSRTVATTSAPAPAQAAAEPSKKPATPEKSEPKLAKVVPLPSRAQKQEPVLSIDRTQELPDENDPRFKEV